MKILFLLGYISTLFFEGLAENVLLLVRKGEQRNVLDKWNTVGGIQDTDGIGSFLPINKLLPREVFRSREVDFLTDKPLAKISLQLLDSQGNVIWKTDFNQSLNNDRNLTALSRPEDMVKSYFPRANVTVNWSIRNHQMAILPLNVTSDVYFSIWDDRSSPEYPQFLFPRPRTEAKPLRKGVQGVYHYQGCYTPLHMNMTQFFVNSGVMSLDLCADACDGTTAKLFAIERNKDCFCGDYSSVFNPIDRGLVFCNTFICTGTTYPCGGLIGFYAVYMSVLAPILAIEPDIPQPTKTVDITFLYFESETVDIGSYASLPFYMTHIFLSLGSSTYTPYYLYYKQRYPCDISEIKPVMVSSQTYYKEFSTLKYESVELIEATCLWIGINNISNGTAGLLKLRRIDHAETFISAPYLAVMGRWSDAETTTYVEETTEAETITEAETTAYVEETTEADTITEAETTAEAVATTQNGLLAMTSTTTTAAETTVITTAAETTEVTTAAEATTPGAGTTKTEWSAAPTTEQSSTETEPVVTEQPMMNTGASSSPDGQTSAVETSTLLSNHVTVSGGICKCRCKNISNMTREEQIARLKALRAELGVNVTELSSYLRKFISVPDSRPSAVGVGVVGVVILAFVVGTIAVLDLTTFFKPKK